MGPFNQDVEWATIIFRTVFGDGFMVENTMTVPAIGIVVVEFFFHEIQDHIILDKLVVFFVIDMQAKLYRVLV